MQDVLHRDCALYHRVRRPRGLVPEAPERRRARHRLGHRRGRRHDQHNRHL